MSTANFNLTPTEDLIMEVLAARYRAGENLWPFDSKLKRMLEHLGDLGLINVMSGNVEKTYRASLTQAGREYALSATYEMPILEKYKLKKKYRK